MIFINKKYDIYKYYFSVWVGIPHITACLSFAERLNLCLMHVG